VTQPSNERWLPVPGYEDRYMVSDQGRVRSMDRTVLDSLGRRRPIRGQEIRPGNTRDMHLWVNLYADGRPKQFYVHRLVAAAFIGDPEGLIVRHLNDVPYENHVENLSLGTASDNQRDSIRNGGHESARRTHCKHGHPFDDANTIYRSGSNTRYCRACTKRWARERYIRNRQRKQEQGLRRTSDQHQS